MGISLRDFLDAGQKAPAPITPVSRSDFLSVAGPPAPPRTPLTSTFAAQSTAAAPDQASRRAAQSARPLLESVDLPGGVQRDLNAAAQGATFGFSDELAAGLRSGLMREDFSKALANERAGLASFRAEHPTRALADELLGGFATTGGAGGTAKGATALARVGRAAATGAAAGGLAGAGSAEGGIVDRLGGAARGAAVGTVLGGALGAGAEGVRSIATRAGETVDQAADRALAERLGRDRMTVDDAITAARAATPNKPLTVLDIGGRNTQRLGRAVRTQPSQGSTVLDQALANRAAGTEERTINDVIATTGLGGRQNAFQKAEDLIAEQKANAKPLYEKAYQNPPVDDPDVLATLKIPQFQQAYKAGRRIAKLEGVDLPPLTKTENIGGESVTSMVPQPIQSLDYIKRGVDAVIEGAADKKGLGPTEARALRGRLRDMLARVDEIAPDYKAARAQYAGDARLQDAFDAGRNLFKAHPDETTLAVKQMGPGEQELFRRGGLEALADRIENRAPGRNPAGVAEKTQDTKRLRMLFPDDASFEAFQKRLSEEATMHGTRMALQGGSQTADKLAELGDMAGVSIDALTHAITGSPAGALRSLARSTVARKVAARAQGVNEAKADALATRMTAGLQGRADLVDMLQNVQATGAARAIPTRVGATATGMSRRISAPLSEATNLAPQDAALSAARSPDDTEKTRRRLFAQLLRSP